MHNMNIAICTHTHVATLVCMPGPCWVGVQELRAARRDGAGAVAATHGTDADPGANPEVAKCGLLAVDNCGILEVRLNEVVSRKKKHICQFYIQMSPEMAGTSVRFFHSERFEGLGLGCLVPFAIMIGFQELFLKRCGLKLLWRVHVSITLQWVCSSLWGAVGCLGRMLRAVIGGCTFWAGLKLDL